MLSPDQVRYLLVDVLGGVAGVTGWGGRETDPIRCVLPPAPAGGLVDDVGGAPCSVTVSRLVHTLEQKRYDIVRGLLIARNGGIAPADSCVRASGDSICPICGWSARNHFSHPDSPAEGCLVVMCDGSVYKL